MVSSICIVIAIIILWTYICMHLYIINIYIFRELHLHFNKNSECWINIAIILSWCVFTGIVRYPRQIVCGKVSFRWLKNKLYKEVFLLISIILKDINSTYLKYTNFLIGFNFALSFGMKKEYNSFPRIHFSFNSHWKLGCSLPRLLHLQKLQSIKVEY